MYATNKAVYTTASVANGWAGAMMQFWQNFQQRDGRTAYATKNFKESSTTKPTLTIVIPSLVCGAGLFGALGTGLRLGSGGGGSGSCSPSLALS